MGISVDNPFEPTMVSVGDLTLGPVTPAYVNKAGAASTVHVRSTPRMSTSPRNVLRRCYRWSRRHGPLGYPPQPRCPSSNLPRGGRCP